MMDSLRNHAGAPAASFLLYSSTHALSFSPFGTTLNVSILSRSTKPSTSSPGGTLAAASHASLSVIRFPIFNRRDLAVVAYTARFPVVYSPNLSQSGEIGGTFGKAEGERGVPGVGGNMVARCDAKVEEGSNSVTTSDVLYCG